MNIIQVYKQFPTQESCIEHLENVRWNGTPKCPYCNSINQTPSKKELRYHCNNCNTSFSVTVGTIFHKTKCDLQKWFLAISLILNAKKEISARQLARDIEVTKDTAWYMLMRIRKAFTDNKNMLEGIIEADETYIGGNNENRHNDKKTEGGQGRGGEDKISIIGILQRNGNVKATKSKDVSSKIIKNFIRVNVIEGSKLMTDEWRGYSGLSKFYEHNIVKHSNNEYVNGIIHSNTLEGFWSLLKRGTVGQYHFVTRKYLNNYISEFCFRYNNRHENTNNLFSEVLVKSLNLSWSQLYI